MLTVSNLPGVLSNPSLPASNNFNGSTNIRQATDDIRAMIDRKEIEKVRKKPRSGVQKLTRHDGAKITNTFHSGKPNVAHLLQFSVLSDKSTEIEKDVVLG